MSFHFIVNCNPQATNLKMLSAMDFVEGHCAINLMESHCAIYEVEAHGVL